MKVLILNRNLGNYGGLGKVMRATAPQNPPLALSLQSGLVNTSSMKIDDEKNALYLAERRFPSQW